MKSAVETLNPTRVRLTVEVPFEELKPSVDSAYKKIAQQVTIPGFRKGRIPPRLIDQRFGRGVVLEEAVNDALPRFYGQAVEDNAVRVVGQPEVDVTEVPDPTAGGDLRFTAEVDVRPEIELPSYADLQVVVDSAEVDDAAVDEELESLRARFATLRGVDRPARRGDFVSIDVAATRAGEPVEDASARGLSYEVGSGELLPDLDDAVIGLAAGESRTFGTTLQSGEAAGQAAEVTATLVSVKERELPALDDDFAQTASEFDTLDELRADLRENLVRMNQFRQRAEARDKVLEALLARVDVPLPESVVTAELEGRHDNLAAQLQAVGLTKSAYLEAEGRTAEAFDQEVEQRAREAIKAQLVLDAIAAKEQLSVDERDLTEHLVRRAVAQRMTPEQFAQQLTSSGQAPMMISEIVRGKALARVLEAASVTDSAGHEIDLKALDAMAAGMTGLDASELSDDLDDELSDDLDDELEDDLDEPADEIGQEAVAEAGGGVGGVTRDGEPDASAVRGSAPATRPDTEAAAQS